MGRAKKRRGAPACFLSGISGWFSLSLGAWLPKNLARRKMASAPRRSQGALTSFVTLARARAFPEFSVPARCCSTGSGRLGGAAAAGGGRDALSYGVSFATTRSHQLARGAPACFLSGISGWFSLSLGAWVPKNLARRKTRRLLTNRLCSSFLESRFQRTSTRQQLDCAKTQ